MHPPNPTPSPSAAAAAPPPGRGCPPPSFAPHSFAPGPAPAMLAPLRTARAPQLPPASSRVVIAVKGPGDSLGLLSLDPPGETPHHHQQLPLQPPHQQQQLPQQQLQQQPTWRACVRAKTRVLALRAEIAGLRALSSEHPELRAAVAAIAEQQQTDLKVRSASRAWWRCLRGASRYLSQYVLNT